VAGWRQRAEPRRRARRLLDEESPRTNAGRFSAAGAAVDELPEPPYPAAAASGRSESATGRFAATRRLGRERARGSREGKGGAGAATGRLARGDGAAGDSAAGVGAGVGERADARHANGRSFAHGAADAAGSARAAKSCGSGTGAERFGSAAFARDLYDGSERA